MPRIEFLGYTWRNKLRNSWSSSNIFDFRPGPMTPTVLDMAALFGFTPHGKVIDVTRDYQRRLVYFVSKPIKASSKEILDRFGYAGFTCTLVENEDEEKVEPLSRKHMFLFYWLKDLSYPIPPTASPWSGFT
ncbi:unnamed protein product [Prunus brigantina]